MKKMLKSKKNKNVLLTVVLALLLMGIHYLAPHFNSLPDAAKNEYSIAALADIPEFFGQPYVVLNDNEPDFTDAKRLPNAFEKYSNLDAAGNRGIAEACIGKELMPSEKRESIGQVKPPGWHTVKYDFIDGRYLYNRCHLIAHQLTGENANEKNLITGTRYMNVSGMLPFEELVADFIRETNLHVLYRVTPVYEDGNALVSGVQMEAESMEDQGKGICFNVFVYNVQPGIVIDYASGESKASNAPVPQIPKDQIRYILNTNSKKIHALSCPDIADMKAKNRQESMENKIYLEEWGYERCGRCKP